MSEDGLLENLESFGSRVDTEGILKYSDIQGMWDEALEKHGNISNVSIAEKRKLRHEHYRIVAKASSDGLFKNFDNFLDFMAGYDDSTFQEKLEEIKGLTPSIWEEQESHLIEKHPEYKGLLSSFIQWRVNTIFSENLKISGHAEKGNIYELKNINTLWGSSPDKSAFVIKMKKNSLEDPPKKVEEENSVATRFKNIMSYSGVNRFKNIISEYGKINKQKEPEIQPEEISVPVEEKPRANSFKKIMSAYKEINERKSTDYREFNKQKEPEIQQKELSVPVNENKGKEELTSGKEIFCSEGFTQALQTLREGGQQAADDERNIGQEYGFGVVNDMGHGDFAKIGHALVDLVDTLPGSNLSSEAKSFEHSARTLIVSHRAVSADLDKKGAGKVEGYIDGINSNQVDLQIRRRGENFTGCQLTLNITDNGELKGGSLFFDLISQARGSIEFRADGFVLEVRQKNQGDLEKLKGKKIELSKIINAITSGDNLGNEDDIKSVFESFVSQFS